jgi:predicted ATPase
MGSTSLLERDELLVALEARLEAARRGDGSLTLLAGEAGSGKTSLLAALAGRVGGDVLVLRGGCDPLSTPRPLGPLIDIALDPASGLRRILTADLEPIDVFAEVLERLRGTIRPTLMVVEDVHWADDATLDFLRFVGRRVDGTNSLVVANAINNLPALLVALPNLEPETTWAFLAGVNMGPTLWITGSLAGLLWLDIMEHDDHPVSVLEYAATGARVGVPAIAAAMAVIVVTGAIVR